jgi:hypothetical protein
MRRYLATPELPTILQLRQLAAAFDEVGATRQAGYLRLCATLVEDGAIPVEQARRHLEQYRSRLRHEHEVSSIHRVPRSMT